MFHAGFAAGDPIGLEQAHLRPAQAETEADRVVDLFRGRDAVLHQPQRLAPDRLEKPVGDMGVDLLAHDQRLHADRVEYGLRALDGIRCSDKLDQRQEIDRVEGVRDEDPVRIWGALLQFGGLEAGGRGADQRIRRAMFLDFGEDLVLEVEPLGHAFLNPASILHGFLDGGREVQVPLLRDHAVRQGGKRAARIGEHFADLALGVGIGIGDDDIPAVEQEAGRPAAADHAAADDGRFLSGRHFPVLSAARSGSTSGTRSPARITAGS